MKINKLLVAAMAALTLASCVKDGANDGGDPQAGKPTVAKITLSQSYDTKATGDLVAATEKETNINEAILLVFGPTNMFEKAVNFSKVADEMEASFETTTGNHSFYVVANAPASVKAKVAAYEADVTAAATFRKDVLEFTSINDIADRDHATGNFFLTNVEVPSPVKLVEATSAAPQEITITIGRASAKVALDFSRDSEKNINAVMDKGALTSPVYKVAGMPKKMYMNPFIEGGIVYTPLYATAYDADNYMQGPTNGDSGYEALATELYMMENTNDATTIVRGAMNHALIRGVFTPKGDLWYAPAADENSNPTCIGTTPATGTSFWRIANVDAEGRITSYEPEYYNAQPHVSQVSADQSVREYENGVCYYSFHFANTKITPETKPERYNIERNRFFRVTITSVDGAGAASEGEAVDDTVKPATETNIKATIVSTPWVAVDQSGGI